MKPYTGTVYRGAPGEDAATIRDQITKPKAERERYWNANTTKVFHYNQFVSTTKAADQSYTTKAGKWHAIHIVGGRTGVDISAVSGKPYEREVLFPPNTTFRVTKVEDKFRGAEKDDANRYNEAPIPSSDDGRIKITMVEA